MDNGNGHVDKLIREVEAAKADKKKDEPKPDFTDCKTLSDREFRAKLSREFGVHI